MSYILPKEISSQMKISKTIYLFDLVFIGIFIVMAIMLSSMVYKPLIIPYYIFMFIMAIYFRSSSTVNPKKRKYQSIYYSFTRDRKAYIKE